MGAARVGSAAAGQAFKEVTDTTAFIENPNIIGDNITLSVSSGNIGVYDPMEDLPFRTLKPVIWTTLLKSN